LTSIKTAAHSWTRNADKITAVKVEVWKDNSLKNTVTLSKWGSAYTGSYTLSSSGTYVLKGKIEWTDGSPIPKMSIFVTWGEDENGRGGGSININQIVGIILTAAGSILFLVKRDW